MSNPNITVIGNATADPELRYTKDGRPVANLTVVTSDRFFDKGANQWVDGDPTFYRVSVWNGAENAANTIRKGMQVIVVGVLQARNYEHNGERRTDLTISVSRPGSAIGPSLMFVRGQMEKSVTQSGGQQSAKSGSSSGGQDPWGGQPSNGSARGGFDEDPPF